MIDFMPRWIVIQVTEYCNLRCKMCYEWGQSGCYGEFNGLAQLPFEVIADIVNEFRDVKPRYDLFGGEPFLHPDIKKIISAIKYSGSSLAIPTNGTLLYKYYKDIVDCSVDDIWISIDGFEEINDAQRGKGSYKKAFNGLKLLHDYRQKMGKKLPRIGISSVITPDNYKSIYDFYKSIDIDVIDQVSLEYETYITAKQKEEYIGLLEKQYGIYDHKYIDGHVRDSAFFNQIDCKILAEDMRKIKEYLKGKGKFVNTYPQNTSEENSCKYFNAKWFEMSGVKKRCPFPYIEMEISARGDVTPCHTMYDLVLGNIYKENIKDIWNSEKYKKCRTMISNKLLPICPTCCLFYNEGKGSNYEAKN